MTKDSKIALSISGGLILLIAVLIFALEGEKAEVKALVSPDIIIEKTWELPLALEEISGFAFPTSGKMAAIQDEKGVIFIYDLQGEEIEQEIPFSGAGDYEGLTVHGSTAYAVESAGKIFEIRNFMTQPEIREFQTFLAAKNNVEGLAYHPVWKNLLLALKGKDPGSKDYKGVYAFDLQEEKLLREPVFRLDFTQSLLARLRKEEKEEVDDVFFPSEIAIHPETGEIYLLEAEKPRLLIFTSEGRPLEVHWLDPLYFPQPEGMNFDSSGVLYISNEGSPATLHQIKIK